MALKGLDIFKLSPKKNCRECGYMTCMAFCMKVAQGGESLDKCPHFSAEGRAKIQEQTEPLMKTIRLGEHTLGGETVLFRHDKALLNRNLYAVTVSTDMSLEEARARLNEMAQVDYTRIGERMYVELVYVENRGIDPQAYEALTALAASYGRELVLECRDVVCAQAALAAAGRPVLLNGATADNWQSMNALAVRYGALLGVWGESLEQLYDTVRCLEGTGNKGLVLDVTAATAKETLKNAVLARRGALRDGERSLGYPSIVNLAKLAPGELTLQTAYATMFTEKYGSILVMERMNYAAALPLYGLRQNIYTDPQKPMKVDAGIYPINGADADSPCLLTVDFALTYFLVSGELERSGQGVNLIIADASGMSVLTAWAAGKLSASSVKKTFEDLGVAEKLRSRTLILPGKVAVLKGEIQEQLPEWNVVVGPAEAVQLPAYMRERAWETAATETTVTQASSEMLSFEQLLEKRVPKIQVVDMGVRYRPAAGNGRFVVIGERIHCIAPSIREAMDKRDPMPILKRAAEQIAAGASYLDVNIGPAEKDGAERMMWAVKLLQENFQNVPLVLDTANKRAIEAGIRVYDRSNGKPVINSADAGGRRSFIDLAAANDAVCIALCSAEGIARDNEERMRHCHDLLEYGLSLGMGAEDLWFDPSFVVVKGMQEKQMEILEAIRLMSAEGLKTTGGVSNNSNGAPKAVRSVMDSTLMAMCMMQGMTSAIVNPNDRRMMETIRTCEIFRNTAVYSDSYLEG